MKEEEFAVIRRGHPHLPAARWRLGDARAELELAGFVRAVIFLHAKWSGPSVKVLRAVTQALASPDAGDVLLWLFDVDDLTNALRERLSNHGARCHGDGESLWVRNGEVAAALERENARGPER